MNDRQENRLGSYRTTGQVLTDNAALFAALPALVTQHQNLLDSISLIDSLAMLQTSNTKGITQAKAEMLRQMKNSAFAVGGAVEAYASATGNLALKARVHIVDSKFTRARDDVRDDIAQDIHDAANENVAALADYGVTAATLSAFQTRIDAYRLSISSPSVARSNRRSKTELLAVELNRAGMLCKERLDGLMNQFRETQPDFFHAYQAAREVIDTGSTPEEPATPPVP